MITVLIPARGNVPYLFQAIKSLFESTLIPSEVLVIDDGISENQLNKLKNLDFDFEIKFVKNDGTGLVSALNTGLGIASNELVARLDSDDMVHKNRFELQYECLSNSPDIIVVGSQVTIIDTNNKIVGKSNYPNRFLNSNLRFNSHCLIAHPSVMYRKSIIEKVGGYREIARIGKVSLCEDFDLWKRLAGYGKLFNLSSELTFYRKHSDQLSERFRYAQELGSLFVANNIYDASGFELDISKSGNINLEKELRRAINKLPKKQKFKFLIYSKLVKEDMIFEKISKVIGILLIRVLNVLEKVSKTL